MLNRLLIRLLTPEVLQGQNFPDSLRHLADYLDRNSDDRSGLPLLRVLARLQLMTPQVISSVPILRDSGHLFYLGAIDLLASIATVELTEKLIDRGLSHSEITAACISQWGAARRDLRVLMESESRLQEMETGADAERLQKLVNSLTLEDGDIDDTSTD